MEYGKIQHLIAPYQWPSMLAAPISLLHTSDKFYWKFDANGVFNVNSAYRLAADLYLENQGQQRNNDKSWQQLSNETET